MGWLEWPMVLIARMTDRLDPKAKHGKKSSRGKSWRTGRHVAPVFVASGLLEFGELVGNQARDVDGLDPHAGAIDVDGQHPDFASGASDGMRTMHERRRRRPHMTQALAHGLAATAQDAADD